MNGTIAGQSFRERVLSEIDDVARPKPKILHLQRTRDLTFERIADACLGGLLVNRAESVEVPIVVVKELARTASGQRSLKEGEVLSSFRVAIPIQRGPFRGLRERHARARHAWAGAVVPRFLLPWGHFGRFLSPLVVRDVA